MSKETAQISFEELLSQAKQYHTQEDVYRPLRQKYSGVLESLQQLQSIAHRQMPELVPFVDGLRRRAQEIIHNEANIGEFVEEPEVK